MINITDLAEAAGVSNQRMYSAVRRDEPLNLSPSERKKAMVAIKEAMEANIKFFDF